MNTASAQARLAFIILGPDWPVEEIRHEYRRCSGIECSYDMSRRVRSTTSHNHAFHFFWLGIGLILLNFR